MKVLISSTGGDLESQVGQELGECPFHLYIETVTMDYDAIRNDDATSCHNKECNITQTAIEKGVEVVIAGNMGDDAFKNLSNAGITVLTEIEGPILEVIRSLIEHEYDNAKFACV